MKIIIADTYEAMSKIAAQHLLGYMYQDRRVNISITAGTTPIKMYELLVPEVKGKSYFENVHYYNFDEIPNRKEDREGVTITDLRKFFFTPAEINESHIHKLDHSNWQVQDERIAADGGLDVILLGIGADGHYCGNLPGTTTFADQTSRIECDAAMKQRIGRLFESSDEIPDYYVTMGPRSVMAAKHIILFASGTNKAEIIKRVVDGSVDQAIQASILKMHPNITLILDKDAAALL